MRVSVVIPARLASTRLPRKMLADLAGRPVLQHVWDRVQKMTHADEIFIATDAEEIRAAAVAWGATAIMTSTSCQSGTERIVAMLDQLQGDFILGVQGDEPFIAPALLDQLVVQWQQNQADIVTPIFAIDATNILYDPNVVKVALGHDHRILYFSRSAIPFIRDTPEKQWLDRHEFWGHIGVYGFARATLERFQQLRPSPLEAVEALEQLRFLAHGCDIRGVPTEYRKIAIDTLADLDKAREYITV